MNGRCGDPSDFEAQEVLLTHQQAPELFEWYIWEGFTTESRAVAEHAVQLGREWMRPDAEEHIASSKVQRYRSRSPQGDGDKEREGSK